MAERMPGFFDVEEGTGARPRATIWSGLNLLFISRYFGGR